MTKSLVSVLSARCQADDLCDRAPCFQARLEFAAPGHLPARMQTDLCVGHLGGTVQAVAAWARDRGLEGKLTVLAIDQPDPAITRGSRSRSQVLMGCGFTFATVAL